MSVSGSLKKISIPDDIDKVVLVNDRYASPMEIIKEGDVVKVFPPVPGG
jgi:molybdopterin converting factor small subunit